MDELKKIILKQDFLLDKIMYICIYAGPASTNFPEYECRAVLKDIDTAWSEVDVELRSIDKIVRELEYEDIIKRNSEEEYL